MEPASAAPAESTPLVAPLMARRASTNGSMAREAIAATQKDEGSACNPMINSRLAQHSMYRQKLVDPGLDNFVHDPNMLAPESPAGTPRRRRGFQAHYYYMHNNTITGGLEAIIFGELRPATVFSATRLMIVFTAHLCFAATLTAIYYFHHIHSEITDFTSGIKDFVDLSVTGIVFLLGGFVTTMLTRWWAYRKDCCGALHQSCSNLAMYAGALFPTGSATDREVRCLIARYSLAAYQLLFIEARAADIASGNEAKSEEAVLEAVRHLAAQGTLTSEELKVLEPLPAKSAIVVGWMARLWERIMDKESGLAASAYPRNSDPGRFTIVYTQLFNARNAISLCHQYMQTQLPYGYIHLILCLVHVTALANSIYCGIHLGIVMKETVGYGDGAEVLVPLIFVRVLRILFIPLLLDGMLLIGTVIAMPLGDDSDDFPAGAFIESLEEDVLVNGAANELYAPEKLLSKKGEAK